MKYEIYIIYKVSDIIIKYKMFFYNIFYSRIENILKYYFYTSQKV